MPSKRLYTEEAYKKQLAANKAYREKNKEKLKEKRKKYYAKNKKRINAQVKEYRDRIKKETGWTSSGSKGRPRKYQTIEEARAARNEYSRKYYAKNKERITKRFKAWRMKNRDKWREYCRNSYNKRREAEKALLKGQKTAGNQRKETITTEVRHVRKNLQNVPKVH